MQRTIRNYYIGKTWMWWQLWLAIKPNLKCTKFAQYKAEYEEKIAIAEANIDKAIAECNKVKSVYERLSGEKNDFQKQLDECNNRVKGEEDAIASLESAGGKVRQEADTLKGNILVLESGMEAAEEDKNTKDNQIRTLKEELAHQEDLIGKLTKEKRGAGESRQKTEEDIQAME